MKKVLVVQPSGLGEAVHTTPLILALLEKGYRVHGCVKNAKRGNAVILKLPGVERVWQMDDVDNIVKQRFDILVLVCGWPSQLSLQGIYHIPKILTPKLMLGGPRQQEAKQGHVSDYYWGIVEALVKRSKPAPRITCGKPVRLSSRTTVGICIGYLKGKRGWRKHWGDENFAELAVRLDKELNVEPVLIGDWVDFEANGKNIIRLSHGAARPVLCRGVDFETIVGAIRTMGAVTGNDTGFCHVAAVLGLPVLALWGKQPPPTRWRPLGPRAMWRWKDKTSPADVVAWLRAGLRGG